MKQGDFYVDEAAPDFPHEYTPEFRLWGSVLKLAVEDLRDRGERAAAMRWINDEAHSVGSFVWICELFGVDRWYARRTIFNNLSRRNGT